MILRFAFVSALFIATSANALPRDPGAIVDALAISAADLPADRRAALVRPLEALGPDAFEALLTRVQVDSPAMRALARKSPAAHRAFRAALVEAIGTQRDARAADPLRKIFETPTSDARLARAAADALGRLCTQAGAIDVLARHLVAGDPRELAAASGLGLCRTERSAQLLAARIGARPDAATTRALADAIGQVGSSWAWQAMGPSAAEEGARVRRTASAALVEVWPTAPAPARKAIAKALLVVDDPATGAAIGARPELGELQRVWTRSHARR